MAANSSRRVLIVDPDPSVRALMHACLRREGYEVESAADSAAALDLWKRGRHLAIVLEPRILGGASLLRELRAFDQKRPCLVIVTTPDRSAPDFALAAGVRSVLYKPFEIDALANAVGDCCDGD